MSNTGRRVVVTGLGMLSPLGIGVKENWSNLLAGKSSVRSLDSDEYKNLPCKVVAKIDSKALVESLVNDKKLKNSEIKSMSLAQIYALVAAEEAIKDSKWESKNENDSIRAGTCIATGMAGVQEVADAALALSNSSKGYKQISPYFVPKILPNLSSGILSIKYKLKGPNHCVTTACAAGSHAILDSYNFVKRGIVDLMVCGATEACIHPISIAGFSRMRALSTEFNDNPKLASRPFDSKRDGFVMSEGAGCLILESLDHAIKRNARIYGEILGGGMSGDANHITNPSPDGNGAFRCMKIALNDASLKPDQIKFVNAHATSTPAGDLAEINAIKRIFSESTQQRKDPAYVTSYKGSIGHLLGAAGAVETIFSILACKEKTIPPSINITNLDPAIKFDELPFLSIVQNEKLNLDQHTDQKIYALKNSFGFGGTNICLVIGNYTE